MSSLKFTIPIHEECCRERTFVFRNKVLNVLRNVLVEVEFPGVQGLTNRPLVEEQHPRMTSNLKFGNNFINFWLRRGRGSPVAKKARNYYPAARF